MAGLKNVYTTLQIDALNQNLANMKEDWKYDMYEVHNIGLTLNILFDLFYNIIKTLS